MNFENKSDAKSYAKAHDYKVVWFEDEGHHGIMYKTKRDERNAERLANAGGVGCQANLLPFNIIPQFKGITLLDFQAWRAKRVV